MLHRKTYFTPEGKVALMFLKMYTGLSSPKLMEHLNGNVHYQLFCDVRIDPMHPLTNYKLARGLKIQQQQEILARAWKPYMKDLDTMYTDAKLLWEGIEKSYETMCTLSAKLNVHRPRTKYVEVEKANLSYRKRRRHTKVQTRKLTRRLLNLLGKILKETRTLERENAGAEELLTARQKSGM